jgi:hypothetical protein
MESSSRSNHARRIPVAVLSAAAVLMAAAAASAQQSAPAIPLSTDTLPLGSKIQTLKYLGDLNDDLVFTPVAPCRLADTRNTGAGALPARAARAFSATSNSLIAAAGGNAAGCGIPAGPTALALTLTAILPMKAGNLVAYADGAPVPLSSALNFMAGQIVANTTVVPTTSATGPNFDLYNNSDGSTHVVVDVVGYFYAPQAPDCVTATQTAASGSGGSFNVTAVCAAGYRIGMGGCATSAATAGTQWQTATFNAGNDGWVCGGINNSGGTATITSQAYCCRKPGR